MTERGLAKKDGNKKNLFSKYSGSTRGKRSGCCCSSEREGRRGLRGETWRGKSIINFSLTPQVPFPLGREGQRSLNQKAEKNRKPLLFFLRLSGESQEVEEERGGRKEIMQDLFRSNGFVLRGGKESRRIKNFLSSPYCAPTFGRLCVLTVAAFVFTWEI